MCLTDKFIDLLNMTSKIRIYMIFNWYLQISLSVLWLKAILALYETFHHNGAAWSISRKMNTYKVSSHLVRFKWACTLRSLCISLLVACFLDPMYNMLGRTSHGYVSIASSSYHQKILCWMLKKSPWISVAALTWGKYIIFCVRKKGYIAEKSSYPPLRILTGFLLPLAAIWLAQCNALPNAHRV